jgi:hypothetical protein
MFLSFTQKVIEVAIGGSEIFSQDRNHFIFLKYNLMIQLSFKAKINKLKLVSRL